MSADYIENLKSNLDLNINPKENFYEYACGGWMKAHPLTGEFARFGTFNLLRENNREQIKALISELENDSRSKEKGTIQQKINDIFKMGMDASRLNREGATPLFPQLEHIAKTSDKTLYETIAWLHNGIAGVFFTTGVGVNPKKSDSHLMFIGECGLGLGDRDYYLVNDENNQRIMMAYKRYLCKLMQLVGYDACDAKRICSNVLYIETEIAKAKHTREECRNPLLRYNMRKKQQIIEEYGNIPWIKYFNNLNVVMPEEANISNPKYMQRICKLLDELTLQQKIDYMTCSAVSAATGLLSDDFYETSFEMYDRVMSGIEEYEPRWKRAMRLPTSMFAEAVGELYVDRYFPVQSKEKMLILVDNLRNALKQHISVLEWMSSETKQQALLKLNRMTVKIGYPDKWKDYSELNVDPTLSYLENVCRASKWYTQENYDKLYKPVDKDEWFMSPQAVNAYYSPSVNEICFPAGILQPPFFNPEADDAVNYGAIGVVIGHEMTHGFDDQGRHYDADGNLKDWWTEEDEKMFNSKTKKLVDQFNSIEVAPGIKANGEFTLGENIADQGGLRLSLTAYQATNNKDEIIDDFNSLQRFYLSYASVWASNIRPEEIVSATKTDPHSIGKLRVNATLRNIDEFFTAFDITEKDKMFRPKSERIQIW